MLSEVGRLIQATIRPYDVAGRYGGDEFVLILPETGVEQARVVANKLKQAIETLVVSVDGRTVTTTASFGIASLFGNEREISEKLNSVDLKSLFEPPAGDHPDWAAIEKTKAQIVGIILSFADSALYCSKRTVCKACGYQSENEESFPHHTCPSCGAADLDLGRGKITVCSPCCMNQG